VAASAHRLARLLLGAALVGLLALAVLGWRLAEGPIPVPPLARFIEQAAGRDGPFRIEIGTATLAWEGWGGAGLTPLELRLGGVRLSDAAGTARIELPDAAVSLAIPWLLRGELAPRRIELLRPVLRLTRDAAGKVALALGEAPPEAAGTAAETGGAPWVDALLAELMRPPNEDTPRGALARLALREARILVADAQLGASWSLDHATIELQRLPGGGVTARGGGRLALAGAQLSVAGSAEAKGEPAAIGFRLAFGETRPAALASLAPALAPLAALDAPVHLDLSGRLDGAGRLATLEARFAARAGALDLGAGRRLPIQALELAGAWRPEGVAVERARLRLDGPGTPLLTGTAEANRAAEGWRARARLALDAAPLAELARWWPEGLGGNERAWILENITAGTARDGQWEIAAVAPAGLASATLTAVSGRLEVEDATVHWLRPMPPAEAVRGRVAFGLEQVVAEVAAARLAGTAIQAREGRVRIGFAAGAVPEAEIALPIAGPLPEVLGALQHPRLRLFVNRPMPLKEPQGALDGRVAVAFPLLADLPVEQLRIGGQARLANVRLADILLGRPIERGQFDLTVDNDGLRVTGQANVAGIATRLGVEMDFRAGPPTQVVMRETVQANADARQLAALDLANEEVVRGPVGLEVRSERRRNGQGRATVRADLREATLAFDPLAWSKPPGQNAGAEAVLRLQGESLAAIESFRVEAPSLLLRGSAAFGRGTRLERVIVAEARVEESRLAGEVLPPERPGGPWRAALRGPVLDMRRAMAEEAPAAPAAPPPSRPGPALALEGRFERVLLGPGRELGAVEARVALDGRGVVRQGRLAGRAGPRGPFELTIAPRPEGRAGRRLDLTAQDAGALLGAFGILEHVEGGRLRVQGTYAHDAPGAPLSGTAEMEAFQVRNAPAFAKLLQAMTLFGLVEALSTEGLGFARLVAPFTLTPESLTLEDARAFSASLGLTAKGTLDRRRRRLAMEGTIVPAYMINALLGNIPLLGRLFSPETGGGVFAATFRLQGPLDDPQVSVNPLAALTPGFLRGIFGLGQGGGEAPAPAPR
jgi:hypothetical protein